MPQKLTLEQIWVEWRGWNINDGWITWKGKLQTCSPPRITLRCSITGMYCTPQIIHERDSMLSTHCGAESCSEGRFLISDDSHLLCQLCMLPNLQCLIINLQQPEFSWIWHNWLVVFLTGNKLEANPGTENDPVFRRATVINVIYPRYYVWFDFQHISFLSCRLQFISRGEYAPEHCTNTQNCKVWLSPPLLGRSENMWGSSFGNVNACTAWKILCQVERNDWNQLLNPLI